MYKRFGGIIIKSNTINLFIVLLISLLLITNIAPQKSGEHKGNESIKQELISQEKNNIIKPVNKVVLHPDSHSWNTAAWDQSKIISYNNYQYTAYWDSTPQLVFSRRNLTTDEVQTIQFPDILSDPDDPHRSTPIGISPQNGRLHIAYDHHNNPIHYRVSQENFITHPPTNISITHFSDTIDIVSEPKITYPRFFNLPNDELRLMFRNGSASNGDTYIYKYDTGSNSWQKIGMLFSRDGTYGNSTSRNAYEHDIVFDQTGRMHVTWTWREDSGHINNHDICYAYSDDNGVTWKNNEGAVIANLETQEPIRVDSPGITVVEVPLGSLLMNTGAMGVDYENQPHVFTFVDTPAKRIHYWRTPGGAWHQQFIEEELIVNSYSRPRGDILIDQNDTLYHIFLDNNTLWCARSFKEENWNNWTIFGFDTLNNHRENPKYDRFRWENEKILSIPIENKKTGIYHFEIRDYILTKEHIIDVNQSMYDRGFPIRHAVDGDWGAAQNFVPITTSILTKTDLYLRKFGTPEFNLTIELRTDDPTGTLIDSKTYTPDQISSSWSWFEVNFNDTDSTPGIDYFIVCPPGPSGVTTSFGYEWGYAFDNQYNDGSFWFTRDGGTLWRDLPSMYEFTFRTYGYL